MTLIGSASERDLRVWALLGARAGDNDQVLALAETLGLPFEVKQLQFNRLHALGPRILGKSILSLDKNSRSSVLNEVLPDLTISTGHRSVPIVRAIRQRSGSRTRSIHVGFPRISPAHFDLVIATPQYPLADHPNLLRIPFGLTLAATKTPALDDVALERQTPRPRQLLVVGGPTLFWRIDERALFATLREMIDEARSAGGSVLVTTSPRTPPSLSGRLAEYLAGAGVSVSMTGPGRSPSYMAMLNAADSLRVTADSVSMISDAIWTAKPFALVPIRKSRAGAVAFDLHDRLRPRARMYPQDLRFFWRALDTIGIAIGDRPAIPTAAVSSVINAVRQRAERVLSAIVY